MGVKDLWKVLEPANEPVTASQLSGLTFAVDLSVWVCEAEGVTEMRGRVTKPYLRNLFFRVSNLLNLGVKLVFAIDGEAPDLKLEEMTRRNNARFGGRGGRGGTASGRVAGGTQKKTSRSHFRALLRGCCELLELMGVPFLQSRGEAEALCAILNQAGLVDGCVTNDGDAFLYGARTVYRNFTIDKSSQSNVVQKYTMEAIESKLNLDREKLIALGLLVGCDFVPKGVPGVGQARAVRVLQDLPKGDALNRLCLWRSSRFVASSAVEGQIRERACDMVDFPSRKVIAEFTEVKDKLPSKLPLSTRPKMYSLQRLLQSKLEWEEEYALEKVLPLTTMYDLRQIDNNPAYGQSKKCLKPIAITKTRVRQFVPVYEVQWHLPDSATSASDSQSPALVTLEKQALFARCFPQLVQAFEDTRVTSKAKTKTSKAATSNNKENEPPDIASDCGGNQYSSQSNPPALPSSQRGLDAAESLSTSFEALSLHDCLQQRFSQTAASSREQTASPLKARSSARPKSTVNLHDKQKYSNIVASRGTECRIPSDKTWDKFVNSNSVCDMSSKQRAFSEMESNLRIHRCDRSSKQRGFSEKESTVSSQVTVSRPKAHTKSTSVLPFLDDSIGELLLPVATKKTTAKKEKLHHLHVSNPETKVAARHCSQTANEHSTGTNKSSYSVQNADKFAHELVNPVPSILDNQPGSDSLAFECSRQNESEKLNDSAADSYMLPLMQRILLRASQSSTQDQGNQQSSTQDQGNQQSSTQKQGNAQQATQRLEPLTQESKPQRNSRGMESATNCAIKSKLGNKKSHEHALLLLDISSDSNCSGVESTTSCSQTSKRGDSNNKKSQEHAEVLLDISSDIEDNAFHVEVEDALQTSCASPGSAYVYQSPQRVDTVVHTNHDLRADGHGFDLSSEADLSSGDEIYMACMRSSQSTTQNKTASQSSINEEIRYKQDLRQVSPREDSVIITSATKSCQAKVDTFKSVLPKHEPSKNIGHSAEVFVPDSDVGNFSLGISLMNTALSSPREQTRHGSNHQLSHTVNSVRDVSKNESTYPTRNSDNATLTQLSSYRTQFIHSVLGTRGKEAETSHSNISRLQERIHACQLPLSGNGVNCYDSSELGSTVILCPTFIPTPDISLLNDSECKSETNPNSECNSSKHSELVENCYDVVSSLSDNILNDLKPGLGIPSACNETFKNCTLTPNNNSNTLACAQTLRESQSALTVSDLTVIADGYSPMITGNLRPCYTSKCTPLTRKSNDARPMFLGKNLSHCHSIKENISNHCGLNAEIKRTLNVTKYNCDESLVVLNDTVKQSDISNTLQRLSHTVYEDTVIHKASDSRRCLSQRMPSNSLVSDLDETETIMLPPDESLLYLDPCEQVTIYYKQ